VIVRVLCAEYQAKKTENFAQGRHTIVFPLLIIVKQKDKVQDKRRDCQPSRQNLLWSKDTKISAFTIQPLPFAPSPKRPTESKTTTVNHPSIPIQSLHCCYTGSSRINGNIGHTPSLKSVSLS
jgi:hypothetical protein